MKKSICIILLLLAAVVPRLRAELMDSVRVEFIVCSPGSEIYELEGHSGLRIYQPGGYDVTFNWGLFDFQSDNFAYRFVKGETDYLVGAIPTDHFLAYYAGEGRSVHAHELNLTAEEKLRLISAVDENMLPENRVYRYNYVKDNCSTRPLRLVEAAVGDTVSATLPDSLQLTTFRRAMDHFHAAYPWYQLGVDIALGSGIDTYAGPRDMMFAPVLADVMLPGSTIGDRKLVNRSYYLTGDAASDATGDPTPWYLSPLFIMSLLLVIAIVLTVRDIRSIKLSRWFDTVFYSSLFVAGLVVTFLIFISSHEATSPNLLLLMFNPLTIIGAVGIWIKRAQSLVFCWQIVNFVALILLLILWLTGPQRFNIAVILLAVTDLLRSIAYIYVILCRRNRKD
ncbi:MAG: DUF4105 domain-containing protein [Muribaculaceae bacterium]|nr:DUF4105 domain-containing protein [Muribaculaceae bacterium]